MKETTPGWLVFKPDGLGDLILARSAILILCARVAPQPVTLVINRQWEALARDWFPDCEIVPLSLTSSRLRDDLLTFPSLWRQLAPHRKKNVLCLRHQRTRLTQALLVALQPRHLYFCHNLLAQSDTPYFTAAERFLARRSGARVEYPAASPDDLCQELEANRLVLSAALGSDIAPSAIVPVLPLSANVDPSLLIVSPFGSSHQRDYPSLGSVLDTFLREIGPDARIHLLCTSGQREAAERLLESVREESRDRVRIIIPPTLQEFVEWIARARAVLSVETSTAHLATSMDKPAVIILGGGHYGYYGPWQRSTRQRWIVHPLPCFNCFWKCSFETIRCIDHISSGLVSDELKNVWNFLPVPIHAEENHR